MKGSDRMDGRTEGRTDAWLHGGRGKGRRDGGTEGRRDGGTEGGRDGARERGSEGGRETLGGIGRILAPCSDSEGVLLQPV
jgi:hypothetical protein